MDTPTIDVALESNHIPIPNPELPHKEIRMSEKEIHEKLRIFEGKNQNQNEDQIQKNSGDLIKEEDSDEDEKALPMNVLVKKLYHLFGGIRVILQFVGFSLFNYGMDHKLKRMSTNWSRTKPEKQLENLPTMVQDIVLNSASK